MRRRTHIRVIGVLLCIPVALFAAVYGAGLRINWTPSYPLGLWRISPLSRPVHLGDHIFICPPGTETFRQALARGYLRRGLCPGLLSPLIKTVAALPGQRVDINYSVVIDGSGYNVDQSCSATFCVPSTTAVQKSRAARCSSA